MVHPLNLPIPLRVVGTCARLGNARQFVQLTEEIVLKFPSLVTMYTGWKSKSWYKIIENLFRHRSCCLVSGWVGLCKPCEVIYYQQNVLKSPLAFLQVEKVYRHHLKRGSGRDALHWCFWEGSEASFAGCSDICWQ